ncbi:nucleotidyl transferase AbiEii/AbiGii toxin family protein [Hymenobacter defluvii]|uniref:Nucleotidyl transferase AbiEii/AbiGii toxin family protein n=1 Tax=Hymenobacter defluvii TaxID=2054411 RepID=A0ABS3TFD7_9BACT|nr:nucleotidyl transferase AbiEii/AbiGii toxin family protein [Hymenobacter defluvii]MBO3272372.1 nucleotidyl transferase AbiEii/AbiGii toxin family protein [Hymenobacter defluvii]
MNPDQHHNIVRLQAVARALGRLRDQVVFVGGATVNLYAAAPLDTPEPRITQDVDCIVEVTPLAAFYQLEEELRAQGFTNDTASGVICRWRYAQLVVDVMPTDGSILGFSNPWYPEGFARAISFELPDNTTIRILAPEYFLATKLAAMRDRGWDDLRLSQDLEDVVHVVDNRLQLESEVWQAHEGVRGYIQQRLGELLARLDLLEALEWTLPFNSGYERKFEIERRLRRMTEAS